MCPGAFHLHGLMLMLVSVRLLSSPMRSNPLPTFSSALDSLSVQTLSELVRVLF